MAPEYLFECLVAEITRELIEMGYEAEEARRYAIEMTKNEMHD